MKASNLINDIITLQDHCITIWKKEGIKFTQHDILSLVEENHAYNFQLWSAEDRARRDDLGHEFVYNAKREIDHCNQQRNNRMESIDEWFFNTLKPADPTTCPVHSETPGMIIDRLSILALKSYHMALQTKRQDVDPLHRQTCLIKSQRIEAQRTQLQNCLNELLQAIQNKTRTFRIYQQFKMYNDPTLNPELVAAQTLGSADNNN